jgi:hypothetical protein
MCLEEDGEIEDWDTESDPDDTPPTDPPADKAAAGLQAGLQAERKKRQELEKRLEEWQTEKDAAEEARRAESGQFKELYEALKAERATDLAELKALKAEKKPRVEAMTAQNTERLEALPEEWRELIPDGLTPSAMARQLDKIEKRLVASEDRPAGGVRSTPPKRREDHIPAQYKDQCDREAKRYGLPPTIRLAPQTVLVCTLETPADQTGQAERLTLGSTGHPITPARRAYDVL